MSAEALLWAVDQRVGDALARFVLLILAGAADEWGEIDATPAQLQRALRHLRAGRWVKESAGAMRLRMESEAER